LCKATGQDLSVQYVLYRMLTPIKVIFTPCRTYKNKDTAVLLHTEEEKLCIHNMEKAPICTHPICKEKGKLTNNTSLKATGIAMLYKKRWEVEIFFKWMKRHLKIKSFWGTTLNAVKVQIYCAIIAYCLVAIIGNKLKVDRPIYEILQILSISLLDKTPIREILTKSD